MDSSQLARGKHCCYNRQMTSQISWTACQRHRNLKYILSQSNCKRMRRCMNVSKNKGQLAICYPWYAKVIYIRLAIVACPDGKHSQNTSGFGKWLVERKEKRKFGRAEFRTCLLWVEVKCINSSATEADSHTKLKNLEISVFSTNQSMCHKSVWFR